MNWLTDKHIVVTGGRGFVGSHVVERLAASGCRSIFVPRSQKYDLLKMDDVVRMYDHARPEVVIHLAAKLGGIGYTNEKPGECFYDNILMGIQVMEQGRRFGVNKFVAQSSVCAYPKDVPIPSREEDLWLGYPDETIAAYGLAKKMLIVQAQAYRRQYGFNAISLLSVNLYGPGDHFEPDVSHVIPAIIRKCVEAVEEGRDEIELWGTGNPSREFLYVKDAAEAIVLAAEKYNGVEPVNIGSGQEITIRQLAGMVARLTGYCGRIRWDPAKPDGQPRRSLDTSRAKREFGFEAKTPLELGLKKTIEWYVDQKAPAWAPPARS